MLDRAHRLTSSLDYSRVSRQGRRRGTRHLVVHALTIEPDATSRVGCITSRAVGKATVRNRVKRRLREIAREVLAEHPCGLLIVLRAKPGAAGADHQTLRAEVHRAIDRLVGGSERA